VIACRLFGRGSLKTALKVLSIDKFGEPPWIVPGLCFEKKELIHALQQFLISYSALQEDNGFPLVAVAWV